MRQLPRSCGGTLWTFSPLIFQGEIRYVTNMRDATFAAEELEALCEDFVGLDCEWKVEFITGKKQLPVALLQVCPNEDVVFLFQLSKIGEIPEALERILGNDSILKFGAGIRQDARKLGEYNVEVYGERDISEIIPRTMTTLSRKWSLAELTQTFLKRKLEKPSNLRLGNWETYPLRPEMQTYAATDAYASLIVAKKLIAMNTTTTDERKMNEKEERRSIEEGEESSNDLFSAKKMKVEKS